MLIYLAEPIDQATSRTAASAHGIANGLELAGHIIYRPKEAWTVGLNSPDPRVEQVNRRALLRADALVAFLPAGVPTIGVPLEIALATARKIPVVVLTDLTSFALVGQPGVTVVDNVQLLIGVLEAIAPANEPLRMAEPLPTVVGPRGQLPTRAYPDDAGLDLHVAGSWKIEPGEFMDVPCDIKIELPPWSWGFIVGRSSTFRNKSLLVLPAVIDCGWRGELFAGVTNMGTEPVHIEHGERVCQLIVLGNATRNVVPTQVLDLLPHARGESGFGSSGS